MSGKCMFHRAIEVEMANALHDAKEARNDIKAVLNAIGKKASTATLITICAILVSAAGIITKLAYDSYQNRMQKFEDTDTTLQTRIDTQIGKIDDKLDKINTRLDSINSFAKRMERSKSAPAVKEKPRGESTYP